jgi:RNA polymerase sigma-70 factor (ECF subfamily)
MTKAEFEIIIRSHQSMVYSIAYNFFQNVAVAEEVAQDVFLQLYQNRKDLGSDAHIVSWLRRTTTHRCIDLTRRRSFSNEIQLDELPEIPAHSPSRDPLLHERLQKLVASLPEKQRIVMILRYTEDMDPAEIGEALDMPLSTVWSHLQRGITLLRDKASRLLGEERHETIR